MKAREIHMEKPAEIQPKHAAGAATTMGKTPVVERDPAQVDAATEARRPEKKIKHYPDAKDYEDVSPYLAAKIRNWD